MEYIMASKEVFEERIEEFSTLYNTCFHQKMSKDEITWKYLKNPQKDLFACFAIDNGKLVANYSVSPIQIVNHGKIIKAVQSLNTMTHPDYMGRGLFVDLAKKVYEEAHNHGYQLVFGFPNYISNRTFVTKLKWQDIYEIPMLELNLENYKEKGDSPLQVVEDSDFYLDYSQCIHNDKISVYKTQAYLKWRYKDNPSNEYTNFVIVNKSNVPTSRIICKQYQNRINIVDYFMRNEKEAECLFRHCIKWGLSLNKDLVTLWSKLGSPEHLILEKLGFRNNYPITYFGSSVFDGSNPEYYQYSNWDIHLGDDNVF